jgi:hypothetical protein
VAARKLKHLEHQGLILDRHYINKLMKEIHADRASTRMPNHALASLQDQMSEIVKAAWEIANDPLAARNMDKTLAMRVVAERCVDDLWLGFTGLVFGVQPFGCSFVAQRTFQIALEMLKVGRRGAALGFWSDGALAVSAKECGEGMTGFL